MGRRSPGYRQYLFPSEKLTCFKVAAGGLHALARPRKSITQAQGTTDPSPMTPCWSTPVRKDEHAKARASSGECYAAKGRNDAHSADAHAARVRSTVQADGLTLRARGKSLHAGWRPHSARATPGTAQAPRWQTSLHARL